MAINTIQGFLQLIKSKKENYETRRRPSKLTISLFESIYQVPEAEWRNVVPERKGLMCPPYLKAIENSSKESQQSRYALIYKDKRPVAAAIFNIIQLSGEDYGSMENEDGPLEKIKKSLKDKARLKVLVCGHTHISGDHGFTYLPEISYTEAFHALADTCYRIRRSEKLRGEIDLVLVKDFYEEDFQQSAYLELFKYHQFKVDPNMILKIRPEWNSFEDYLHAMNTKYRKKALSVMKQGTSIERRILSAEEIQLSFNNIQRLYTNVASRAKVRINRYDAAYFVQLKRNLDNAFRFTAYYLNGEMIAFSTIIFWGENCEAHSIGINYDVNNEFCIYQNMLYDFVKAAISERSEKLILGRTAMEMKSNIGAEPYEMCCYVRHSGPLLNRAFKPIFNYIKQTEWTQRSPFKETPLTGTA